MTPTIGTPEWFAWHAAERARTRRERIQYLTDYRPAITGPSGEQFWWRRDQGPVPAADPSLAAVTAQELPAEVEDELARLKDAIMTAPPAMGPAPKALFDLRPDSRSAFQKVFDRNKIAS